MPALAGRLENTSLWLLEPLPFGRRAHPTEPEAGALAETRLYRAAFQKTKLMRLSGILSQTFRHLGAGVGESDTPWHDTERKRQSGFPRFFAKRHRKHASCLGTNRHGSQQAKTGQAEARPDFPNEFLRIVLEGDF